MFTPKDAFAFTHLLYTQWNRLSTPFCNFFEKTAIFFGTFKNPLDKMQKMVYTINQ